MTFAIKEGKVAEVIQHRTLHYPCRQTKIDIPIDTRYDKTDHAWLRDSSVFSWQLVDQTGDIDPEMLDEEAPGIDSSEDPSVWEWKWASPCSYSELLHIYCIVHWEIKHNRKVLHPITISTSYRSIASGTRAVYGSWCRAVLQSCTSCTNLNTKYALPLKLHMQKYMSFTELYYCHMYYDIRNCLMAHYSLSPRGIWDLPADCILVFYSSCDHGVFSWNCFQSLIERGWMVRVCCLQSRNNQ